ncbi:MAG TPA: NAD(P)H-dependent oxidoreductase subunit E [Anaerolineaceae bacterium]|jgi:NADH:ubiquinone oxidoreductase subunit E|nr:NAD(P)H-dependent oxidoreductase subunit E [Longilinea sp.]HPA32264.1 NAD(P)H-dependent oxidoreductase subunit E [Anaerolineaceae bacterium]HQO96756.1 NAD(P)H-dependent oxidoreductase subunit E [Anaerolineaceae bacterium]HQP59611.1 NAD(P)H-dependent oxidoreductase subunit E [Anaerolineaceae bacterium]
MTIGSIDDQKITEVVDRVIAHHGATMDELIPILNDVNKELGYLPGEALKQISKHLHVPRSQLFAVSSFYQMLSTKPRGRHVIQFCESAPCHVVGGREVWKTLREELKLEANETSPDGKWTLATTSCLGLCSVGPVIIIDDDVYGNLTPDQIPGILARYS